MNRFVAVVLFALAVSLSALRAADEEPAIRPDPRPTDLTSKKRGTNDEPTIRPDPRPLDVSAPKQSSGRSTLEPSNRPAEIEGLTLEQSNSIRAIRQRAETDVQAIHDRERAEIMMVLSEQQRVEFLKREREAKAAPVGRATTAPASAPATP